MHVCAGRGTARMFDKEFVYGHQKSMSRFHHYHSSPQFEIPFTTSEAHHLSYISCLVSLSVP